MLGYTRRDSLAENRAIVNKQVCILKLIFKSSNEGYSASGLRYQSDGARVTHPLPHSEFTRIRERTCDLTLTLSHSPFAYFSYISSYSLLIIPSAVL